MVWAIFALSGCAIMFFGYDTAVMSQVNTNADYLRTMGLSGGSDRDAAGIGGMVSLWFGGFAVGKSDLGGGSQCAEPLTDTVRVNVGRFCCRQSRTVTYDAIRVLLGNSWSCSTCQCSKHHLALFRSCHQRHWLWTFKHSRPHLDIRRPFSWRLRCCRVHACHVRFCRVSRRIHFHDRNACFH